MKKILFIVCLFSSKLLFAQFGQITNVQIIPANPTDADQVKAVVEVMIGSSPCQLDNYTNNTIGNTIALSNNYCGGMLPTICSRTDTINLFSLSPGIYNLNVNMAVGCGPYTLVDSALNYSFTVSVFSGINAVEKESIFSLFPNPTSNSVVNLQSNSTNTYSMICYNSVGQEAFAMSNLSGNQIINLPKERGIYFIKVIDQQNNISILKCLNISK
jgi:hypothetical protein